MVKWIQAVISVFDGVLPGLGGEVLTTVVIGILGTLGLAFRHSIWALYRRIRPKKPDPVEIRIVTDPPSPTPDPNEQELRLLCPTYHDGGTIIITRSKGGTAVIAGKNQISSDVDPDDADRLQITIGQMADRNWLDQVPPSNGDSAYRLSHVGLALAMRHCPRRPPKAKPDAGDEPATEPKLSAVSDSLTEDECRVLCLIHAAGSSGSAFLSTAGGRDRLQAGHQYLADGSDPNEVNRWRVIIYDLVTRGVLKATYLQNTNEAWVLSPEGLKLAMEICPPIPPKQVMKPNPTASYHHTGGRIVKGP